MMLAKAIYALTQKFPTEERYGMTSQLRRAAASVLANLAEGFSRTTNADKAHKYIISKGECAEIQALLLLATELAWVHEQEASAAMNLAEETGRLLYGLVRKYAKA